MASGAWEKRNESARQKGYRNYYDYRAHGYGRRTPTEERLSGEALRRARGHASGADLARTLRGADSVIATGSGRDADGRYSQIDVVVRKGDKVMFFTLRGEQASQASLKQLKDRLDDAGIGYLLDPSLDVFSQ